MQRDRDWPLLWLLLLLLWWWRLVKVMSLEVLLELSLLLTGEPNWWFDRQLRLLLEELLLMAIWLRS